MNSPVPLTAHAAARAIDAVAELRGVHKTYRLGQHVIQARRGLDLKLVIAALGTTGHLIIS